MIFCKKNAGGGFVPLQGGPPPWSRRRIFSISDPSPPDPPCAHYADTVQAWRKKEVLKYKKNTIGLSQKQQYSRMVNGVGPNGKYTWASQSRNDSFPNIQNLPPGPTKYSLQCKP